MITSYNSLFQNLLNLLVLDSHAFQLSEYLCVIKLFKSELQSKYIEFSIFQIIVSFSCFLLSSHII